MSAKLYFDSNSSLNLTELSLWCQAVEEELKPVDSDDVKIILSKTKDGKHYLSAYKKEGV